MIFFEATTGIGDVSGFIGEVAVNASMGVRTAGTDFVMGKLLLCSKRKRAKWL